MGSCCLCVGVKVSLGGGGVMAAFVGGGGGGVSYSNVCFASLEAC